MILILSTLVQCQVYCHVIHQTYSIMTVRDLPSNQKNSSSLKFLRPHWGLKHFHFESKLPLYKLEPTNCYYLDKLQYWINRSEQGTDFSWTQLEVNNSTSSSSNYTLSNPRLKFLSRLGQHNRRHSRFTARLKSRVIQRTSIIMQKLCWCNGINIFNIVFPTKKQVISYGSHMEN